MGLRHIFKMYWFLVKTDASGEIFEETSIASPAVKKMSNEDIVKHTATIKMQIEVTKFLANCERKGVFPMQMYIKMLPNTGKNLFSYAYF